MDPVHTIQTSDSVPALLLPSTLRGTLVHSRICRSTSSRFSRVRAVIFSGLNPIEQAFSKIENILRKLGARTHETLLEAMEEALSKVTPADAAGWFDHCGYQVEVQYL